jgi:hypothetical protein
MKQSRLKNRIRMVCPLVAATLILPALAYADNDHGRGNWGENHGRHEGRQEGRDRGGVPVVPEANAGWVLIPFFGAVLLLTTRQLFRGKVTE